MLPSLLPPLAFASGATPAGSATADVVVVGAALEPQVLVVVVPAAPVVDAAGAAAVVPGRLSLSIPFLRGTGHDGGVPDKYLGVV